jgi:hypothetical protein
MGTIFDNGQRHITQESFTITVEEPPAGGEAEPPTNTVEEPPAGGEAEPPTNDTGGQ